ncbi:hypothetical protein GN956_G461 [Arapaima gigas]
MRPAQTDVALVKWVPVEKRTPEAQLWSGGVQRPHFSCHLCGSGSSSSRLAVGSSGRALGGAAGGRSTCQETTRQLLLSNCCKATVTSESKSPWTPPIEQEVDKVKQHLNDSLHDGV